MKLLILDKDFRSSDLLSQKNSFQKNEECLLINFSVNNFSLPEWFKYKIIDISNTIFSEYKINKNYLKKKFKKNLSKNPEFVEYKISEINYADSIYSTCLPLVLLSCPLCDTLRKPAAVPSLRTKPR